MGISDDSAARSFTASEHDLRLIAALRSGDETAFAAVVDQYSPSMLRVALLYVSEQAVAEEVVQEAWIGVLRGLDRFEGRSSLKTWIFTILTNRAKTRAQREGRYVPLPAFDDSLDDPTESAVSSERFRPEGDVWAGHWAEGLAPRDWDSLPEEALLSQEARATIFRAIDALPPNQRQVIRLRDVEGWSSEEVCNVLAISETNQRVLLHRARSRVRQALEDYLSG
jgi:RNA polymerase sigma-70 factor (ECF subfamily)